jgi:hypothetical protein
MSNLDEKRAVVGKGSRQDKSYSIHSLLLREIASGVLKGM